MQHSNLQQSKAPRVASTLTMSTLTTFHLFPNLPIEIRLKIWSFDLSIPRTVTISCIREPIIRGAQRTAKVWSTDTPMPVLLHVNRESRYEALSIYTPYFTTPSSPRPIYLSFSLDVVKFADGVIPYIPRDTLVSIRTMVLETKDCAYFGLYNMEILKSMSALRELEIFADRGTIPWWDEGDRHLTFLMSDFEEAREQDPGWECPRVKFFDSETGKQCRYIEGGAKIPGGVPPEE